MSSLVFPVTQVYLGESDPHLDTHKVAQPEVAAQTPPGTALSLVQSRAGSKRNTSTFLLGQCLAGGNSALPGVLQLHSLAEHPQLPSQTFPPLHWQLHQTQS